MLHGASTVGQGKKLNHTNVTRISKPQAASCLLLLLLVVVVVGWWWAGGGGGLGADTFLLTITSHTGTHIPTSWWPPPHPSIPATPRPQHYIPPSPPSCFPELPHSRPPPTQPPTHPGRSCWLVGVCRQECEAQSNRERIINGNVYRNSENVSGIQKKNIFPLHSIFGNTVDRIWIDKTSGSGSCWRSGDAAYHVLCCPLVACSHRFSRQLCRCRTNSEYESTK